MNESVADQRFLVKGAESINSYLESEVLFWPLQAESQPLTLGNLLLAQKKVAALPAVADQPEVKTAFAQIDLAREKTRAAWQTKAGADFHARLDQYKSIVLDLSEEDGAGLNFSVVARLRIILDLLFGELSDRNDYEKQLVDLDQRLRKRVVPSGFIWPEVYQSAFPIERYWFLYSKYQK